MVKLQETIDKKGIPRYSVTIPRDLVDNRGWKKGEKLFFLEDDRGRLIIADKK